MKSYLLTFSLCCLTCLFLSAQVIYVNQAATGSNNGTNWQNAYTDLHGALQATTAGDTVWVAQGIYFPTTGTDRNLRFELPEGIVLAGGFAGTETNFGQRDWQANETILSGDIGVQNDSTDNSYTILFIGASDTTTVVDGFVFKRGTANSDTGGFTNPARCGGAIYIMGEDSYAYPRIRNCRFEHNYAEYYGGAVYVNGNGDGSVAPQFYNCIFNFNHAGRDGGAIRRDGGSWVEVENDFWDCVFTENKAGRNGGGVFYYDTERTDTIDFVGCKFFMNISSLRGGGIVLYNGRVSGSNFILTECIFEKNKAESRGGGIEYLNNFSYLNLLAFEKVIFKENKGTSGAAAHIEALTFQGALDPRITFSECLFHANESIINNVGVLNVIFYISWESSGPFKISKSIFSSNQNNSASNSLILSSSLSEVEKCIFTNNGNGPIITNNSFHRSKIIGNLFSNNQSKITSTGSSNPNKIDTILNCTFYKTINDLVDPTIHGKTYIGNSIFLEETGNGNFFPIQGDSVKIESSLFSAPDCTALPTYVTCAPNNLFNLDPLFTDTAASDFTLLPCSPAINAGNNAIIDSLGILTDLAGNPRIRGGTVDMGAYEAPPFSMGTPVVQQPLCNGENGTVAFQPQHACPPFFLEWDGGPVSTGSALFDTLPAVLTLPAGSYAVTLTDGRMNSDTVSVALQAPELLAAAVTATAVNCPAGPGGTAIASPSGGTAPYAYSWSNGDTLAAIANLAAGTYAFTLTDANGCTLTDSVAVTTTGTLPLGIDVSPITCHGSADGTATVTPVSGTAPYAWGWPNGETSPTLDSIGGGSYAVTVTDALGCKGTLSFSITPPPALALSVSATDVSCAGAANGTATVAASGGTPGYGYLWDTGAATATASNLAPGWHAVTVTDANGCTDTAGVTIAEPTPITAAIAAPALVCFGETGTAAALPQGGTPPYAYLWQGGQTDSLLTGLPPGPYALTVTDANGCTLTAQSTIAENPEIQVLFEIENASAAGVADGSITLTLTLGGSPPYAYLWNTADTTASLQNIPPGSYAVTVTDAGGCTQDFTFEVDIETAAGERDTEALQARIVPNPSGRDGGAKLMVTGVVSPKITVRVYDAGGRQVSQGGYFTEKEYALPDGLAVGLYWVVLENERGEQVAVRWLVQ